MKGWQKNTIDHNMVSLCTQTKFCPEFMDCLQTNDLITSIESEEFERIQKHEKHGSYECNQYLYGVLKTRTRAFDILINLLKEFDQDELAEILEVERSSKLEDSPVLAEAEGHQPACEVAGTSTTDLKRALKLHTAGTSRLQKCRKLLFDLQDPTPLFVGRKKELEDLHKLLTGSNRLAVITHITSVSGLGGIGKTEIARKYADDYKSYYDNNVIWLNAESEESLISSFIKLASDKLDVSIKTKDDKQKAINVIVDECYQYFSNQKSLFVLDNVEKSKYLKQFLPRKDSSTNIYVLITSRHQDWGKLVPKLEINVFSEEEAMTFVRNGLEIEGDSLDDEIRLLVCRLQYFPLALNQAISYIYYQQQMDDDYSVEKYLEDFETNSGHLLDCDMSDELESDYAKTTFTTWKITIQKIAQTPAHGNLAVIILNLVSYFSPDDIHRDSFFKLDHCTHGIVKEAVNLLIKYSMVSANQSQSVFSIHRLVQEVVRIDLRHTRKESEVINLALQLAEECLSEKFLPHAVSAWNYARCIPEISCKFVNLATRIMIKFRNVGRYNEAIQFGVTNLDILKTSHLVNKQTILEFEYHLGDVFRFAGEYETSLYYLERVEEECNALGKYDTLLLQIQEEIACVFNLQGKHSKALELSLKICQSKKSIFGDKHLSIAKSLFTTSGIALTMGKYDLSYSAIQEGFICYEKADDKDEVCFLRARHNFALLIADRGDFTQAISILKDIHAKIISSPDLEIPYNLKIKTLSNLSSLLNSTNKYDEAQIILEELCEDQKIVLGEDHRDTLITSIQLGRTFLYMKKLEEAYSALHSAYLKLKEKYGSESEWTLNALRWCAEVLSYQGQHSTAISYIATVVETYERTIESTSAFLLSSKLSYAEILARNKNCEEAAAILEELKDTYLQIFGADHPNYLNCVEFIGKIKLGGSELEKYLEL